MTWRPAKSISVFNAEANAVAPNRKRTYDGTIGDAAHAARASSHNPNNAGVVCGNDITDDPAGGMDCESLFEFLRTHPHRDLRYIIHNHKAARRVDGWKVEVYTGENPHVTHLHLTVGGGSDSEPTQPYDDTDSWNLAQWKANKEDDDMAVAQFSPTVQREMETAQDELVKARLLGNATRPIGEAAPMGYVDLMAWRIVKALEAEIATLRGEVNALKAMK